MEQLMLADLSLACLVFVFAFSSVFVFAFSSVLVFVFSSVFVF